ncbi:heme peroxidase [Paramyrothecium foliicola]|nr:heme peroxidase [Paramyrothecium foliicola]
MASTNRSPNDANGVPNVKDTIQKYFTDFKSQLGRLPEDIEVVKALAEGIFTENIVDDREQLLENTIKWASSYPTGSPTSSLLTHTMLNSLWENLQHPPLSYMGDEWRYRAADGSHNNILYPDLGKAGSYYARSVVPKRAPSAALPDPGDVFDALFARKGPAKEHPTKISSMLFSLATLIIHDIFRTEESNPNKVACSSYLDLGPLYGHNQAMQDKVRTFKDGKLKPDAFAEPRILGQPPGVGALLVSFNRFHNYVVTQLAEINEGGRFTASKLDKAKGLDGEKAEAKRDNDLFQTGRLITCGLYVNVILYDYVRVILNLNRSDTTWTLDPRKDDHNVFDKDGIPKGIGNQVSMEFNLLYRWHATVSNKSEAWVNEFMQELWPGQDPATLTQAQLYEGLKRWGHSLDADPGKWTFGGLKRNDAGGFDDAGLISLLNETTEDVAGAFGARNVPTALRAIEILGINQGRNWGTASLNEVRRFFKLKPHATFLDINPDPDVAASLQALYREPDNVELYPGLVCEDTKRIEEPGSGLCAGLTVAKAILSDAVSLVRGDRYYTVDFSPANLTSFGFNEIAPNPDVAFGTTLHKVFQRAYPGWYRSNSVYALFPFNTPSENRKIFAARGIEADYDYDEPRFEPPATQITTWNGVSDVLKDQKSFQDPWASRVFELSRTDGYIRVQLWEQIQKACSMALTEPSSGMSQIRGYLDALTTGLIEKNSTKLRDTYQIDVVRDVANPSHAILAAQLWDIPLKGKDEDSVGFTPDELYEALAMIFWYTFLDKDGAQSSAIQSAAKKATSTLSAGVSRSVSPVEFLKGYFSQLLVGHEDEPLPDFGPKLIKRLRMSGASHENIIWAVVHNAAATATIQSQALARLLDFYLSPTNASHWADIQALASSDSDESLEVLRKYVLEGLRLDPAIAGTSRVTVAADATINDGSNALNLSKGQTLLVNYKSAGLDATVFPEPQEVKLDRPESSYIDGTYGGDFSLDKNVVATALAVQLRAFGRLKNLRRANGPAGQLKSTSLDGGFKLFMTENWGEWTPFPSTWRLYYDK